MARSSHLPLDTNLDKLADAIDYVQERCKVNRCEDSRALAGYVLDAIEIAQTMADSIETTLAELEPMMTAYEGRWSPKTGTVVSVCKYGIDVRRCAPPTTRVSGTMSLRFTLPPGGAHVHR